MPYPTSRIWLGVSAAENPRGTAAAPAYFIPIKSPAWEPQINMMKDSGLRGQMSANYDQVAGLRYDKMGFDCGVYADSFPALVRGALGSTDGLVGTTAPYSHTFGLLNTGTGQPPSYTIVYFDGLDMNQLVASQVDSLVVKFDSGSLMTATVAYVCNAAVPITTVTNTPTALEETAGWHCIVNVGGVPITRLVDGEIDYKRGTKPIPAITGLPGYYANWAGPLDTAGGKITVIMESDAELNYFLTNAKGTALDLKFTDPGLNTIDFHFSNTLWSSGKKNPGKDWGEVDLEWWAQPNSTDVVAGGGGALAPGTVTITNAVSAAY
jgi:hypothetical protein